MDLKAAGAQFVVVDKKVPTAPLAAHRDDR
jgi:hypothetical protein